MIDDPTPPVAKPWPTRRDPPIPEPKLFVPRWPDGTEKAEKFWKQHERDVRDDSIKHREGWRRDRDRDLRHDLERDSGKL